MGEDSPRRLACDCGYMAQGEDDDALVTAVQAHAGGVHGMTLPAELILNLAANSGGPFHGVVPEPVPPEPVVPPQTTRPRR